MALHMHMLDIQILTDVVNEKRERGRPRTTRPRGNILVRQSVREISRMYGLVVGLDSDPAQAAQKDARKRKFSCEIFN